MPITVKLYGRFRDLASSLDSTSGSIGIVKVDPDKVESASDLLKKFNLDRDEVSHVFVNGSYASLKITVDDMDKVALFPEEMGLLYSWYF
ncbi:MAG: hypothetical protein V5A77_08400 [Candidatus Bipolaricaulota bacterium]